jgi:hypothetical protein
VASYVFGLIVLAPFLVMFGMTAAHIDFEHLASHEGVPIQWATLLSLVLWTSSGWDDVGQVRYETEKERRKGERREKEREKRGRGVRRRFRAPGLARGGSHSVGHAAEFSVVDF